ncbi:MAG TPA: c-type cytochrome [Gemmatimonadales bacterium]|jgi:cytochrome c oxidase cbb3-type subunit 3|nr:c-type cytochrome [Gemmatimonadales bacterium]
MHPLTRGAMAVVGLAAAACTRVGQDRPARVPDRGAATTSALPPGAGVRPGIHPQAVLGAISNPYTGDKAAIMAGRRLFTGMNCAGCHSGYAGGGMGPSLRDSLWIYGNGDAQIFSSIAEGRPYGMPAWAGRLQDDQIWRLVAYIRTLGTGNEPVKPPTPSHEVSPGPTGGPRAAG